MNRKSDMPFTPSTIALYSVGLLGGSIGAGLKASGYPAASSACLPGQALKRRFPWVASMKAIRTTR